MSTSRELREIFRQAQGTAPEMLRVLENFLYQHRDVLNETRELLEVALPPIPAREGTTAETIYQSLVKDHQLQTIALRCKQMDAALSLTVKAEGGSFTPLLRIDPSLSYYDPAGVAWDVCCGRNCCKFGAAKGAKNIRPAV